MATFDQQPWFTPGDASDASLGQPFGGGPARSGGGGGGAFGYGGAAAPRSGFGYDPSPPEEPPLLEELGVDFADIWSKTKIVLRPSLREVDERLVEESDLAGPVVFVFLLGGALVLRGKLHFGSIYGFGLTSCVATYALLNLMAESEGGVTFAAVASFLGYCLLPVVLLAVAALVVAPTSAAGQALAGLAVLASTCTATRLFEAKLHMRHQRYLVAYPLALIYSCFVLITIF